ncbi:MAG: hypothetical protein EOO73_33210 [Myxococcales bacterium]|nr:MAG: hypothetical protein EOO73_33210 [Myxococcales bacterium]
MKTPEWPFDVPPGEVVVTTTYVTKGGLPILSVVHELDEDEGIVWQFHCGNGDYDNAVLQLVRLDEILRLEPGLLELAGLPLGHEARRDGPGAPWRVAPVS